MCLPFAAVAATYKVGGKDCEPRTQYEQPEGVEVTPGTTAEGWATAPADITPPALKAEDFDQLPIFLDVPLADYLPRDKDSKTPYNFDASEAEIGVGQLRVGQDSSVTLNGRDITGYSTDHFSEDCLEAN